jgi:hypothetical protein
MTQVITLTGISDTHRTALREAARDMPLAMHESGDGRVTIPVKDAAQAYLLGMRVAARWRRLERAAARDDFDDDGDDDEADDADAYGIGDDDADSEDPDADDADLDTLMFFRVTGGRP